MPKLPAPLPQILPLILGSEPAADSFPYHDTKLYMSPFPNGVASVAVPEEPHLHTALPCQVEEVV